MRIVAVVHPPEVGGLHAFWGARVTELSQLGIEVLLVLPESLRHTEIPIEPSRLIFMRMSRSRSASNVLENLRMLRALPREARELMKVATDWGAEAIVSHGPHYPMPSLAARLARVHSVVLLHSDAAPAFAGRLLSLIRRPTIALAESEGVLARYARGLRASHVGLLRPATPMPTGDWVQDFPHTPLRVGTLSVISPRKRLDIFLDVAEHCWQHGRDWHFRVAGRPAPGHPDLWEAVVRRISYLSEEGLDIEYVDGGVGADGLYRRADVLLLTSDQEGVPNVVMEAIVRGRRVVALDLEPLRRLRDEVEKACGPGLLTLVPRGVGQIEATVEALSSLNLDATEALTRWAEANLTSGGAAKALSDSLVSALQEKG